MRCFSVSAMSVSVLCALSSGAAFAQADDAGAARLLAVFQTYLGTADGGVAVRVEGDDYLVTIEPALLSAAAKTEEMTTSITPLELTVTDNGDGTWDYAMDQPVSMAYAIEEIMSSTTEYGQVVVAGVFDEALGDSSQFSVTVNDIVSEQTQSDEMGEMTSTVTQESLSIEGKAEAAGDGVNSTFTMASGPMTIDMAFPAIEGGEAVTFNATVAEAAATGSVTGYQPAGVYGLLAYFVAHPSEELLDADRAGMKAALEAALPVFDSLQMDGSYSGVVMNTSMGAATINEVGLTIDMNGVVAEGKFREAIRLQGLKLAEGMVPPFAAGLVPSDVTLDFTASGFDLAAAALLGLGTLDLPADAEMAEGFDQQMMAALLPKGAVDITIAPGEATATDYRLTYEGNLTYGPGMLVPFGKARIGLTGADKITAALEASPPELGLQDFAPMVGMAQMMAQQGVDGELIWELEATESGGLLINGQNMMGGGQ